MNFHYNIPSKQLQTLNNNKYSIQLSPEGRWTVVDEVYSCFEKGCRKKCARDNPERYCGWFWVLCSTKKFERMAREAIDVCLRILKESNNRRLVSCSVRNSVLIISHITLRDCRVHIFSDNLSRNSWISSAAHRPWGG